VSGRLRTRILIVFKIINSTNACNYLNILIICIYMILIEYIISLLPYRANTILIQDYYLNLFLIILLAFKGVRLYF